MLCAMKDLRLFLKFTVCAKHTKCPVSKILEP